MSGGFDWEAIRNAYPLSTVAAQAGVKLQRAGRDWKACCPFHHEKTPSFTIYSDDTRFKCFGCGAQGDVVDFVATLDGTSPQQAVATLTGGNIPTLTAEDREERAKWLARRDAERQQEREHAIAKARQRWDMAIPIADTANAYLERKRVAPYGARQEGDRLILPIYDRHGEVQSVQTIAPDGSKLFQRGAPTDGGRFWIGLAFGHTVICEGFATGASIYEASPYHVCVAFSKGNMVKIAREMAEEGRDFILAADTNAQDEMRALGAELSCPVAVPACGSDFNDQMIEAGVDSVRESFANALLEFQQRPAPPPEPPFCEIAFVDAMDYEEKDIPLRPWIVPGALMSGLTHILAAPGGTGKSLFTLQFALMLATGSKWGKWKPKRPCKVLVINAEDDVDEQRRRLSAARSVMGLTAPPGHLMIASNPASILVATVDEKTRRQMVTPLVDQLVAMIRHYEIDVVMVDPFAETFEGDENSNNDAKWVMKIWRDDIARATGCAVYLVHHTTKNAGDKAGSADAIRGAGALVNSARFASTMFVMTENEAAALGVKPEHRFRYVRYDDAKANLSPIGARQWFEKVSVVIGNGNGSGADEGDEVGALKPWDASGLGELSQDKIDAFLQALDTGYISPDGVCTDIPYSPTQRGGSLRWAGYLLIDMLGIEEDQARTILTGLMDRGIIAVRDFHDATNGRTAKGVFRGPKSDLSAQ